jgi:hypothetical protein
MVAEAQSTLVQVATSVSSRLVKALHADMAPTDFAALLPVAEAAFRRRWLNVKRGKDGKDAKEARDRKDSSPSGTAASPATGEDSVTSADIAIIAAMVKTESPFAMSLCRDMFVVLRDILLLALPGVQSEAQKTERGTAARAGSVLDVRVAIASENPWTAVAVDALSLLGLHLWKLTASITNPALLGLQSNRSIALESGSVSIGDCKDGLIGSNDYFSTFTRIEPGANAYAALPAHVQSKRHANKTTVGVIKTKKKTGSTDVLGSLLDILKTLSGNGAVTGLPSSIIRRACDAIDTGLAVLYPTAKDRHNLLQDLIHKGATLEFYYGSEVPGSCDRSASGAQDMSKHKAVLDALDGIDGETADSSAADEHDQKPVEQASIVEPDVRMERAALLLRMETAQSSWPCKTLGQWGRSCHVLVSIPPSDTSSASTHATDDPVQHFTRLLQKVFADASIGSWSFPAGCTDPPVPMRIQRNLSSPTWQDAACVRLYPASAGSFAQIEATVRTRLDRSKSI